MPVLLSIFGPQVAIGQVGAAGLQMYLMLALRPASFQLARRKSWGEVVYCKVGPVTSYKWSEISPISRVK